MKLTDEQRTAIRQRGERVQIIAGAGAGKTAVLIERVARLVAEDVDPSGILVCTFTEAAAEEIRQRWMDRAGGAPGGPRFTTLHAFAWSLVRRFSALFGLTADFSVYDQDDATHLRRACMIAVGRKAQRTLYETRLAQANAIDYDGLLAAARTIFSSDAPRFAQARAEARQLVRHVIVDEAQDLEPADFDLLDAFEADTLTLAGDPRQSIFGFRGADPDRFNRFGDATAILTVNHRSTSPIVALANDVAGSAYPPMRVIRPSDTFSGVEARLAGVRGTGDLDDIGLVRAVDDLVCEGIPPGEIAVVGRTWSSLWSARAQLLHVGREIRWTGESRGPWDSEPGRALAAWLRAQVNQFDDNLLARVLATFRPDVDVARIRGQAPPRWPSNALLVPHVEQLRAGRPQGRREQLAAYLPAMSTSKPTRELAEALLDLPGVPRDVIDTCRPCIERLDHPNRRTPRAFVRWWTWRRSSPDALDEQEGAGRITLTTVHGAKGREWRAVVGLDVDEYGFPGVAHGTEIQRILYVLITRARDRLILLRRHGSTASFYLPPGLQWS